MSIDLQKDIYDALRRVLEARVLTIEAISAVTSRHLRPCPSCSSSLPLRQRHSPSRLRQTSPCGLLAVSLGRPGTPHPVETLQRDTITPWPF